MYVRKQSGALLIVVSEMMGVCGDFSVSLAFSIVEIIALGWVVGVGSSS